MADVILELIAVEAYLFGVLFGIFLYSRQKYMIFVKYSWVLGIIVLFVGCILRVYPVIYAGCFTTCIILGPLLVGFLNEIQDWFRR